MKTNTVHKVSLTEKGLYLTVKVYFNEETSEFTGSFDPESTYFTFVCLDRLFDDAYEDLANSGFTFEEIRASDLVFENVIFETPVSDNVRAYFE